MLRSYRLVLMAVLFVLTHSRLNAKPRGLVVASKDFTEAVLLGDILTQSLQEKGVQTQHLPSLGSSPLLWKALLSGDIDAYGDYTGTVLKETLSQLQLSSDDQLPSALAAYGVGITRPLGFNNTYILGMRHDVAHKYHITRISDLKRYPEFRFGFSTGFVDRNDGWPMLKQRYQLPQNQVTEMDHEITYRALTSGAIEVTNLYSTDAEIKAYEITPLDDDLRIFPEYDAVYLYRLDTARREPRLLQALASLEGSIDAQHMVAMNAEVKIQHKSEESTAQSFLAHLKGQRNPTHLLQGKDRWNSFLDQAGRHLLLVFLPLLLNILIAVPLGILATYHTGLGRFLLSAVSVAQTIPSLALLVLFIPILGVGFAPALAALFVYGMLPIMKNTYLGLKSIPLSLQESSETLGLSPLRRLMSLELPLASPMILAGIKVSAVLNVGTATLGAIIGAGGFGEAILTGVRHDDMNMLLRGAVPSALLALLIQALFSWLESRVIPRGLRLTTSL